MDNEVLQSETRMSGYLHKKGKLRMVSSWKRYWFVLKGRLLLYYRSREEYETAISPCKGSINLGPPCTVKSYPSSAFVFQVETRATTFTFKAENAVEQKKWMQAIMAVLNQNQNLHHENLARLSHFRYSLDDLVPEHDDSKYLERQNSMPHKLKLVKRNSADIIQRLQKIGAHSYGGSLGAISKITSKMPNSPIQLRNSDANLRNIYERISSDSNNSQNSRKSNFIVDNENYSVPLKKYHNNQSVIVDNDQYYSSVKVNVEEDVIYAEPKITDYNRNSVVVENSFYGSTSQKSDENLYEDLEDLKIKTSHYSEPIFNQNNETSSQNPQPKMKLKDKIGSMLTHKDSKPKQKQIKKSKSFIRRVWKKKKSKSQEEEIYEEIDRAPVEKIELNDDSAVQMLSELQNILENKKKMLMLRKTMSDDYSSKTEQTESVDSSTASTSNSDQQPDLPPKMYKSQINQQSDHEQVRSIDEILEDLDKEKVESRNKVKMLIDKFNEPEIEDEVVLRKHLKPDFKIHRHSDELSRLLDELAKVTSAPIMTPGVTSSLINPNLSNDEWLKLLPIRQRRLSEPDYDVPRSHKSLQNLPREDKSDIIPATRFFGPALPLASERSTESDSICVSMTPDSLEIDESDKSPTQFSYSSHNYSHKNPVRDFKCFSHDYSEKHVIYASPKPYLSVATHIVNTCQNICGNQISEEHTIIYKNVKNIDISDEVFRDSLELSNNDSLTDF